MPHIDSSHYISRRRNWTTFIRDGHLIGKIQVGEDFNVEVNSLLEKNKHRDALPMFQSTYPMTVSERRRMRSLEKREKVANALWVEAKKTLMDALGMEERRDCDAAFTLIASEGSEVDAPQASVLVLRAHIFTPTRIHTL